MKNNFLEFKLCDELTSCISIFSNMETKGNLIFCIEIKKVIVTFFLAIVSLYLNFFFLELWKKLWDINSEFQDKKLQSPFTFFYLAIRTKLSYTYVTKLMIP